MKKLSLVLLATSMLGACQGSVNVNSSSKSLFQQHVGRAMEDRKIALIKAETNRQEAVIDAETQLIKVKAAATENKLIIASVNASKTLLSGWKLATSDSEVSSRSANTVVYGAITSRACHYEVVANSNSEPEYQTICN